MKPFSSLLKVFEILDEKFMSATKLKIHLDEQSMEYGRFHLLCALRKSQQKPSEVMQTWKARKEIEGEGFRRGLQKKLE